MKKYLQVEAYVPFQKDFLKVEELGGISETFIVFNPDYSDENPDYKIQLTEKVLLKDISSDKLIPIGEMVSDYVIMNSSGDEIADSDNLRSEFADFIIEMIMNNITSDEIDNSYN